MSKGKTSNDDRRKRKKKKSFMDKGLLFYILDFFKAIRKFFKNLIYSDVLGDPKKRIVVIYSVLIILCAVFISSVTNKNSYGLYVDDVLISSIPFDKEISFEDIYNRIIINIENKEGTKIKVNEKFNMVRENAKKKSIIKDIDAALLEVSNNFTYKLEATQIYIAGEAVATVKSETIANSVLENVAKRYIDPNSENVTYDFVEQIELKKMYTEIGNLDSEENIFDLLSSDYETSDIYTVVSGDNLNIIASKMNITLDELLELNPTVDINAIIKIGQTLNVISRKPLLSVKTTEEVSKTETIPYETEEKPNENEGTSYRVRTQRGKDGEMEVVERITKVNGVIESTEVYEKNIIVAPTPEIFEVGTKP